MCRCDTYECGAAVAEFIDSRIGMLVAEQADPPLLSEKGSGGQ
jgi:hypothetical protein